MTEQDVVLLLKALKSAEVDGGWGGTLGRLCELGRWVREG